MKAAILFAAALAVLAVSSARAQTFRNPILSGGSADPFVFQHDDGYYYWAISVHDAAIDVMRTRTLSNWDDSERRRVFTAQAPYSGLWAPEIHFIQGNWYIYFALETYGDNANHRNYVIKANDPFNALGSYSAMVQLKTTDSDVWGIDGTVLQYGDGNLYYIWSGWPERNSGMPQNLYIAKMANPWFLEGPRVLLREPKSGWETIGGPLNEGAQVLQRNGRTFVVFSASGSWTADYCLGIIGIDGLKDPMNPANWWQDVDRCVFWRNDAQNVFGVGHASFTKSPDGTEDWIVYHAMERPDGGWAGRTTRAEKFGWNADGSPAFPRPSGFWNDLPVPSGQDSSNPQ